MKGHDREQRGKGVFGAARQGRTQALRKFSLELERTNDNYF